MCQANHVYLYNTMFVETRHVTWVWWSIFEHHSHLLGPGWDENDYQE